MELKITINLENQAFKDDLLGEVIRVIESAGRKFYNNQTSYWEELEEMKSKLIDSNGNPVGFIEVVK